MAAGAAAGRASRAGVAATAARASRRVRVRVPDGEGRSRPKDSATKDRGTMLARMQDTSGSVLLAMGLRRDNVQSFRAYRGARVRGKKYTRKKNAHAQHIYSTHMHLLHSAHTTLNARYFEILVYTVLCGTPRPGRRRDRVLEAGRGCRRERAQLMLEVELEVGCSGMLAPSTTSE